LFTVLHRYNYKKLDKLKEKYVMDIYKNRNYSDTLCQNLNNDIHDFLLAKTCINKEAKCATCSNAAKNGHIICLKYAHENGCKLNSETCKSAASNGHLECLKYAYENGCEWNSETCKWASQNGHLECLKYAHENGCEWNIWTCAHAAGNGHLKCLK